MLLSTGLADLAEIDVRFENFKEARELRDTERTGRSAAEKNRARLIAPHFIGLDEPVDIEPLRFERVNAMETQSDGGDSIGINAPSEK